MEQEKKEKKNNFSLNVIEVLVSEVECNHKVLFGTLSGVLTNKKKNMLWEKVAITVNAASSQRRSFADIKKKSGLI